jgi:mono/diheme cytochrome c family protein
MCRRLLGIATCLATMLCTLSAAQQAATGPTRTRSGPAPVAGAATHRATLDRYCVTCHNPRLKTGGLAIDQLASGDLTRDAEAWERVVRQLRAGSMPPRGLPRPDPATYDALIAWLEGELDSAGTAKPGRPTLRRLNRAEYANAVRDLLGLEVDVAGWLPPDESAFGFDNVADAQGSSPALLQAYLAAARRISAVAVGDARLGVGSETYSVRQDLSQDVHLEGLPLGTVGGLRARHIFPLDGEYEFQVRLYRTNLSAMRGLEDPQELELTLDGDRILTASIGGDADLVALQTNPTDTSDAIEATRLRVRRFVRAGQRDVAAAFIEKTSPVFETNRLQRFVRDFANPFDAEGAPHVQSIAIQGPFGGAVAEVPPSARVFVCMPGKGVDEASCVRRILSTLAERAYRRPVSNAEMAALRASYDEGRTAGSFRTGVQFALRRMLASPSFVFRPEAEPPGLAPGTPYPITGLELASRLSFFLWSSIPDENLLRIARAGRLRTPAVLTQELRRMLADPRSSAFVTNFAGQWLQLRNLRGKVPNSDLFPDFDDNLRQAFLREAELLFASVVTGDRSVVELMTADYTFVNARLARHYGIPGTFTSDFRRVPLTDPARHGLLGKGALLLVTSHATTTSPVLRGKWVLENVLGTPPPPPPANLDTALKTDPPGSPPRTMRAQMERHRSNAVCASCHQLMDPIGFALEGFDVDGAVRTRDRDGLPLDTSDVLSNGTRVNGAAELRQALVARPDLFVQTLTEKLLVYALGRGLTYEDMPIVRAIVRETRQQGYRFSALLGGIVASAPFQMRLATTGPDPATR